MFEYSPVAKNCCVDTSGSERFDGVTEIALRTGGAAVTLRAMVALKVNAPEVAVTLTFANPTVAAPLAVRVSVAIPEPGAGNETGLNEALTPAGKLDADSPMGALNPFTTPTITLTVAFCSRGTVTEVGAGVTVKSAAPEPVT